MHSPSTFVTLFIAASQALSFSADSYNETETNKCSQPHVRKEWRTLDQSEQDAYISAIQCLKHAPSQGTKFYNTLQTRYDDFVALHINATRGGDNPPPPDSFGQNNSTGNDTQPSAHYGVHGVGIFLPWHRYTIWTFESALRTECNYAGVQPYWDWTLDSPASNASLLASPVLRAFGGNGSAITGCVEDGPFVGNASIHIGPADSMKWNPRCLTRVIDQDTFDIRSNWDDVFAPLLQLKNYKQVQLFIDELDFVGPEDQVDKFAGPHSLMHSVFGGDFSDVHSSPNDPLFWLHHTFIDYLWNLWQQRDEARLRDISGARTMRGLGPEGDKVENTTLDTPLWMGFMTSDVPVRSVMDTTNGDGEGVLCYRYGDSPSTLGRAGF